MHWSARRFAARLLRAAHTGQGATWGKRAVATLWDVVYTLPGTLLVMLGYVLIVVGVVINEEQNDDSGLWLLLVGLLVFLVGVAVGLFLFVRNSILRQGRTGYTWGKARVGIRVVREADGQPMGAWVAGGRWLLHSAINQACYLDYLWPLWDDKNQTLTDKILSTVVVNQRES
jgi:uncharacterized RDD family membrane protein YckC